MTSQQTPVATASTIAPATEIGVVGLSVADLDRSVYFYVDALGCAVIERRAGRAVLGVGDRPLICLTEQPDALPWMVDGMTGLYHLALLLPTRADLGRWLGHYVRLGYPPPGQGDHIVSEAFYLRDPDGHGIEVYADRPRSTWSWHKGQVRMGTGPIDVRGLLAEAARGGEAWSGLPAGSTLGHMHLQVGNIDQAAWFYGEVLGFDIVAQMPTALFVSAGAYHHHLGLNTWHSDGAAPAPPDTATLLFYSLALPDSAAREAVAARLSAAGVALERDGERLLVRDPWGHVIALHVGPVADAAAARALVP